MEMSVVETQRLILKWQEDQLLHDQSCLNEFNLLTTHSLPGQAHNFPGCGPSLNGLLARPIKADPGVENGWVDNDSVGQVINSCGGGYGLNYGISRTASCPPPLVAAETIGRDLSGAAGRESFNKRKSDKSLGHKGDAEEDSRSKRSKGCEEEEESKVTEQQNSNRNSNGSQSNNLKESNGNNKLDKKNREASGCTSKDNSINVEKPDYIHVRARRGQATDSHSLAERVRREKISERMKYLQDLVPGCNKITGKAGMLDEIINYVQSLQRQVEFLSMKLAAVNPRLDFSIDELIAKEVFAACSTSMPTMGVSPDMSNPNYIQYNPIQQMDSNPIDMGLRRTISAPVSVPETFINPSCFNLPSSLPWDAELQNIYAMEFQQGRSTSFPLQTFTGTIEDSS